MKANPATYEKHFRMEGFKMISTKLVGRYVCITLKQKVGAGVKVHGLVTRCNGIYSKSVTIGDINVTGILSHTVESVQMFKNEASYITKKQLDLI